MCTVDFRGTIKVHAADMDEMTDSMKHQRIMNVLIILSDFKVTCA